MCICGRRERFDMYKKPRQPRGGGGYIYSINCLSHGAEKDAGGLGVEERKGWLDNESLGNIFFFLFCAVVNLSFWVGGPGVPTDTHHHRDRQQDTYSRHKTGVILLHPTSNRQTDAKREKVFESTKTDEAMCDLPPTDRSLPR